MILKYLVQVELTPEQAREVTPDGFRRCIRRAVQNMVAELTYQADNVTVVREETPEIFGPEMHFRPCDCGAYSLCKKCNGLGVIKFAPQ